MQAGSITIRDVGPRDGLQGESPVDVSLRVEICNALVAAGLRDVEAVAFVSPRAVPSMAGAADVLAGVDSHAATWWALVPNRRGAELALACGVRHLTVTVSASAMYSAKNVGMTIAESVTQVESICRLDDDAVVDAVVSCAFGSPFDVAGHGHGLGEVVTTRDVEALCASLRDAGVERLTLADTTGTATPRRIKAVLDRTGTAVGLHLHDTRGTALTNAYVALQLGVTRFDAAVGGLGGSPFAPGAGGNLATEALVLLADDLGIETGIDLAALLDVGARLRDVVGRELPSRVLRAGPLPRFAG